MQNAELPQLLNFGSPCFLGEFPSSIPLPSQSFLLEQKSSTPFHSTKSH